MDVIQSDVDELETLFGKLSECTSDHIREKKIPFDLFLNRLTNLHFRSRQQHKEFLLDLFSGVSTVDKAWAKLNLYWDFLNYSLLDHLVYKFGNQALMSSMEVYKMKLKAFRLRTRVCDFTEYFNIRQKNVVYAGLKNIEAELKKKWEECTLQDLEEWKENITQGLLLPSFVLILQGLNPGCVCVMWAIPAVFAESVMRIMETMDTKDFYMKHDIISLRIDGKEFDKPTVSVITSDQGISQPSSISGEVCNGFLWLHACFYTLHL